MWSFVLGGDIGGMLRWVLECGDEWCDGGWCERGYVLESVVMREVVMVCG